MGYKIIDDNTAPFIKDHNGDALLQNGLATWSEGSDSTEGIKATKAGDPNTFYTDNRIFMRLLSNDLNLMFNLDRTIYVSKKGTVNGMKHGGSTSIPKIQHFSTITAALSGERTDYNSSGYNQLSPARNNTYFWSSAALSSDQGMMVMVGPGTYEEDNNLLNILSGWTIDGYHKYLHIKGYGNKTVISTPLNCDVNGAEGDYYNNNKPLLLENIVIANLNAKTDKGINTFVTFKNVVIAENWSQDYFNLTNCKRFNGEIVFTDAKAIFTGTNFWTLYKNNGIGMYKQTKEKQYIGESTE